MIDLDQLEQQLEQATTGDVRVLRGVDWAGPPRTPDARAPEARPPQAPAPPSPAAPAPGPPAAGSRAPADLGPAPVPADPIPPPSVWPVETTAPRAGEVTHHRRRERVRPAVSRPRTASAPTANAPAAAAPAVARTEAGGGSAIADLFEWGRVAEAEEAVNAHARATRDGGSPTSRRDAAAWTTTLALLEGRADDARRGLDLVLALGQEAQAPDARERWWLQRYWLVLDWGTEDEWYEMLDHCRERAYRFDDRQWWPMLALVLTRLGHTDEAVQAFDAAVSKCLGTSSPAVDVAASLAEAAARLGDTKRAEHAYRALRSVPPERMVMCRPGFAFRGSVARYQALAAAMTGHPADADRAFRAAVIAHRGNRAEPLLARTMHEWGRALEARDDMRAAGLLGEAAGIAARLGLRSL